MSEPSYIVIRDPECEALNGRWYDVSDKPPTDISGVQDDSFEVITYVPTPFIEVREDGAVAQVFMRKRESE